MLWGWWPGGCWLLGWLLVAPPLLQDAHGWCTWKRRGFKRREPSSHARVAWRFLYISSTPPQKKSDSTTTSVWKMMHLPGKPETNGFRPLFSRKPPVGGGPGKPPPKLFEGQRCQELLDQQLGNPSFSLLSWVPRMWTRAYGVEGASFLAHVYHRSWKSPRGRGVIPSQCHLKPYNRLLLRAYEAIDCPLIDKWPAALGGG